MNKKIDEEIVWSGLHGTRDARVRVQIFDDVRETDSSVCILTEPPDNPGTSVTNGVETIIKTVCDRFGLAWHKTLFVEHYVQHAGRGDSPETFDVVFVEDDRFGRIRNPQWTPSNWLLVRDWIGAAGSETWEEI